MSAAGTALGPRARPRPRSLHVLAGEQLLVAGGQLTAGVGNLAFSLVAARLLAPGAFAQLAAFLALYLVLHVPTASLSAGSAVTPGLADRARARTGRLGLVAGAAIALAAVPAGAVLHLPTGMLLALAAAAPAAGLLALERGRLYGLGRTRRASASLLAEPLVRLAAGITLGAALGPTAAAAGVVLAGWAALAVARTRATGEESERAAAPAAAAGATVLAFLGLAVIQNADVLAAGALLAGAEAGRFAVLSTLGGVAAFATTTVPLMLLPRASAGERRALPAALGVAALLGLGAVAAVAADPAALVTGVFGERYAGVAPLAVPYLIAMALLGVARVLVAHACATGAARPALAALGAAVALHATLLLTTADDAAGIARATLIATVALTAAAGGAAVVRLPVVRAGAARTLGPRPVPVAAALGVAVAGGLALRLAATRGLWLDEATSVDQAQMPFGHMLDVLRAGDVHPPLHHAVLWVTVRVLGTSEEAVRLPSLLAMTVLVPVLYATARELWDRRAGLAAAALGAVAPFPVWYAQEARMYALFMLLATLALWLQVRALRRGRLLDFALWALAAAALMWTQYFALLFVGAQQLGFLAAVARRGIDPERRRRLLRGWIAALVLAAAAVLPLVPFALDQFTANEAAGRGFGGALPSQAGATASQNEGLAQPSVYAAITNALWAVGGYHSDATMTALAALWPLGVLGALAALGRRRSGANRLLVACAVLPMAGLFVLGQVKPFVFEVRYFSAAVPIALLLIARASTAWTRRTLPAIAAGAVLVGLLGVAVADQQLNSSNPRQYDFRAATERISRQARPGDVVLLSPPYVASVVSYYGEDGLRVRSAAAGVPAPRRGQRVFVLGSFSDKRQYADLTRRTVTRLRGEARLTGQFRVPQVRVWEFSR